MQGSLIIQSRMWNFRALPDAVIGTKFTLNGERGVADLLLNYRLQMKIFCCNWELPNAYRTNENRSVRAGQVD